MRGLKSLFVLATSSCIVASCSPPLPAPDSRREPVIDVVHGVTFQDDYRWLEDQDSDETREWIVRQNAYAEGIVGESELRDHFRTRLRELTDLPDVGATRRAGGFEYFTMRRIGEEAPVLYRRPFVENADKPMVEETYESVLDPVDFDPSYRTLVSMTDFSEDGTLMMFSVRQGGADEVEVRIRDLVNNVDLPDRLPNALYSGLDFDDEGTGFYYTHRDRFAGPRIRHHVLGTDSSADAEVWGEGYEPTAFIGMDIVAGGRFRIFTVQHGWASNDIFIQAGNGPIRPIVEGVSAHFQHRFQNGRLYVLTDWLAPNYRLMLIDPANPEPTEWTEVISESEDVLESYAFIDGSIYATYLHEVAQRIRVFDMEGVSLGEIDVPDHASVGIRAAGDNKATLSVNAHLTPPTSYEVDLTNGERTLDEGPEVEFDESAFEVTKLWFESTGGVRAPIYVIHRAGIELDGSHPTILSGYGGFNASTRPGFSASRLPWLELGGVYAVATLRGGAEFGESWHQDGMLENKQHVFDDFIAASEALIAAGYTSPDRLGISGGSNGGLLVASAMTQRPDLYRAVLCTYPDLDMVRFWSFQTTNNMPALLEYGDARIPAHFDAIRQYSPYQAVRDGVDYPAVMLTTGDLDTRVSPLQARKMTARLQAATGSKRPVVLWYDSRGGHAAGRGRPISMLIEDTAREMTFMAQQLGVDLRR
ncbi:MAG: prolyl oligopeptidase family serine peptidase [Gemmatimonadetes bacterium]|nr:prolyl oligopeptidase family serine peptidase [Gemmatimonadota bacterium]MDA1102212.1 prolyl oligopeptidase family serine peptidase [Gemmatimonadota bacterium]